MLIFEIVLPVSVHEFQFGSQANSPYVEYTHHADGEEIDGRSPKTCLFIRDPRLISK